MVGGLLPIEIDGRRPGLSGAFLDRSFGVGDRRPLPRPGEGRAGERAKDRDEPE